MAALLEAGVPQFIDFIVRDMPQHQVPMQEAFAGWICNAWENMKAFRDCSAAQQICGRGSDRLSRAGEGET